MSHNIEGLFELQNGNETDTTQFYRLNILSYPFNVTIQRHTEAQSNRLMINESLAVGHC